MHTHTELETCTHTTSWKLKHKFYLVILIIRNYTTTDTTSIYETGIYVHVHNASSKDIITIDKRAYNSIQPIHILEYT